MYILSGRPRLKGLCGRVRSILCSGRRGGSLAGPEGLGEEALQSGFAVGDAGEVRPGGRTVRLAPQASPRFIGW